uniref:Putative induced by hypoxia n=1 Tax=Ornithodoros turicata TaxID=34597 RepID=A0A2R5LE53_9ACAR
MADEDASASSDNLEWVPSPSPRYQDTVTFKDKLSSKVLSNPFVPIGLIATVSCLVMGLNAMRTNQPVRSQMMMRGRVLAQGFTIAAILVGIMMSASSRKKEQ